MIYVKDYSQTLVNRMLTGIDELSTQPERLMEYPLLEEKWLGLIDEQTEMNRSSFGQLWSIKVLSPSRAVAVPVQKV